VLEWQAPRQNTDGSTTVELEEAEVLRRVVDVPAQPEPAPEAEWPEEKEEKEEPEEKEEVGEPPEQQEEATDISPEVDAADEAAEVPPPPPPFASEAEVIASFDSAAEGEPMSFRDAWDPLWEKKRIEYAVRHRNRRGRWSPLSSVAFIDPLPPLPPPTELDAEAGDALVRLQWSSPVDPTASGDSEQQTTFGFNIFRRAGEGPYPPAPINPTPVIESFYEDRSAVFGQRGCYVVRRVALAGEPERAEGEDIGERVSAPSPLIESADSVEVCLTPVDTFPPPVPTDLIAVESQDGIFLSWSEVESADLGGYLVYRSLEPEGPFERVIAESTELASFTDHSVEHGVVYYYAVSAVDRAEPPNESPLGQAASATAP